MIKHFEDMKAQLSELAAVLNEFKSETVQMRILEWVLGDASVDDEPKERPTPDASRRIRTPKAQKAKVREGESPAKRKKAPAGAGAPATLTQLLSSNFFDETRTINDIIEHCKHNLARTFKANEFSGKLGRLVRSGELTREKNAEKQYEYKKP
jgi:hypothetical protein